MKQSTLAYQLAKDFHEGQTRRDGVTPYFNHVERVAEIVKQRGGGEKEIAAAYLHDIFEENENLGTTFLTDKGVDSEVVMAVCFLTHQKKGKNKQSYQEYVRDICQYNPIARAVKIADNLANLSDTPTDKQIVKHAESLLILMDN
jgi:(p)ppGpp synthase/HD superfamily hydrolase